MKMLFDSLDAMLAELRDRKVAVVRISPAIEKETGARTGGIPYLTARVIVNAAIDDHLWTDWRHWVGRAVAEISERGFHLPAGDHSGQGTRSHRGDLQVCRRRGLRDPRGDPRPRHRGHGHV